MPTVRLSARERRADGVAVLRIEVPYEFDEDQAALALAIVYAEEPLRRRVHALRDGLVKAIELRSLEKGPAAPQRAVDAYRERLRELDVFPDERKRQEMLARLREGQQVHRQEPPETRPTAPLLKLPAIWAKHEREDDGRPVVRVEVPTFFDLERAAQALAIVYRDREEPLRSANALRLGLQQAAREDVRGRRARAVDPQLVARYRAILVDEGVFPVDE